MKRIIHNNIITSFLLAITLISCKKEYGSLNGPSVEDYVKNATPAQLNSLVTGSLSGIRNNENTVKHKKTNTAQTWTLWTVNA